MAKDYYPSYRGISHIVRNGVSLSLYSKHRLKTSAQAKAREAREIYKTVRVVKTRAAKWGVWVNRNKARV